MDGAATWVQVVVTATGVVVAYIALTRAARQLKNQAEQLQLQRQQIELEYNWRRKQYAVNMLAEWNEHTAPLRRGIDAVFTGLLDTRGPRRDVDIKPEIAHKIYDAQQGSPAWEIKCHLIELLNYCEYVAVSFSREVGDHAIMKDSFQETLIQWHAELKEFIKVTEERRGRNPWKPFSDLVERLSVVVSQTPSHSLQQTGGHEAHPRVLAH